MSLRITRARTVDLPDIMRLHAMVQNLHAQILPNIFRPDWEISALKDFWLAKLADRSSIVAIAIMNRRTVGYIWFQVQERTQSDLHQARKRIYIHHIGVEEGVRRRGLGGDLIKYVEAEAIHLNISTITLDTWASNATAQEFFTSRGYDTMTIMRAKVLKAP